MSYVFDASSIIKLVELNPDETVNIVDNQYTVDLAQYEIGSYLWKVSKTTSVDVDTLLEAFNRLLKLMRIMQLGLSGDVLGLARRLNITYYDASYVYLTMRLNAKLITEDGELLSKLPNLTMSIKDLL